MRRTFPPGSSWLYGKLYAAPALHDRLIVEELAPLGRRAEAWHVVRYADPDEHLRIRLRGNLAQLRPALERLAGAAIGDGRAWRFALDTYEREVERYGDIEAAEGVFSADSHRVTAILAGDRRAPEERWITAAGSVLALVLDLGVAEHDAAALLERCRGLLDPPTRRAHAARQREHRAELEAAVAAALEGPREPLPRVPAGALPSLVHMHLNRLLRWPASEQEVAACDAAARTLTSLRARAPDRLRAANPGVP